MKIDKTPLSHRSRHRSDSLSCHSVPTHDTDPGHGNPPAICIDNMSTPPVLPPLPCALRTPAVPVPSQKSSTKYWLSLPSHSQDPSRISLHRHTVHLDVSSSDTPEALFAGHPSLSLLFFRSQPATAYLSSGFLSERPVFDIFSFCSSASSFDFKITHPFNKYYTRQMYQNCII